jgi:hypothetical protein
LNDKYFRPQEIEIELTIPRWKYDYSRPSSLDLIRKEIEAKIQIIIYNPLSASKCHLWINQLVLKSTAGFAVPMGRDECQPNDAYVNILHSMGIFMFMSKQSSGFATGWVVQNPFEGGPSYYLEFYS